MLPPRQAAPSTGPVLDPDEPEVLQKLRKQIHAIRVSLIRSANRLGFDHDNGLVKQVLYRLNLAEKLKAPWRRGKRPDPALAAARDASRLEHEQGTGASLDYTIKMMLIGLTGTGKTQLIHSLLAEGSTSTRQTAVDPFEGGTKGVQVVQGMVHGIKLVCIDTPGLVAAASQTAYNGRVLREIHAAYKKHKPDLVVYVDRLDSPSRSAGELPALKGLSDRLGPGLWLNTIVVLSHAGATPPKGPKGQIGFDTYANQRSHVIQQVIRHASGDGRLMNPMAFVESHPQCATNSSGQAIIANGMPWKPHLYLMIVSAKLLADTENMLQMQEGGKASSSSSSSPANNLALQQMMAMSGGARQLPLPYLMSSLTQQSKPLKFPDHERIMELRRLEALAGRTVQPRQRKDLVRQVKARLLQMRQAQEYKDKMQRSFKNATLAGGKVTPEPPRLATRRPPSVHPPGTYRYRVPEPTGGWLVRPNIEQHGMDNSDGIEGLYMEKTAVAQRGGQASSSNRSCMSGVPYQHAVSAQCSKEHKAVQLRSQASLYHDTEGLFTSTLSMEAQNTGGGISGVPLDVLWVLRYDVRRKRFLRRSNKATLGLMMTRLAESGRPDRGPAAVGMRMQESFRCSLLPRVPAELSACGAYITTLPALSKGSASEDLAGEAEVCTGAVLDITAEMQDLFNTRYSLPLTLSANTINYKGDSMRGLSAALQYKLGKSSMAGGRLQLSNKGKAGLSLKVKSGSHWWVGLLAMLWPLGTLVLEAVGVLR